MAYTDIDKPSDYFNIVLYTGNAGTQAITGVGFAPNWVWGKARNATEGHSLHDTVRGTGKNILANSAGAEEAIASVTAFGSDGFTLGSNAHMNNNNSPTVAWCWKAGGSASTNSSGSTNSSVSVNTDAGFSIVSYTGAGATTYGHGLGVTPNVIIIKKRTSDSGNNNWFVYHDSVITAGSGIKTFLTLNETEPLKSNGSATTFTSISSTTFGVGTDDIISESSHTFIAYCFAEKQGYSKFGSYKGNGNANGTFVYTGFKPAFIMVKNTSTGGWQLRDNKRTTFNLLTNLNYANSSSAEQTTDGIDFLSNGWKLRNAAGDNNASGTAYIYMAFAENPFVTSTGVPATAR